MTPSSVSSIKAGSDFKTDRITAATYSDRGMKPFKPSAAQTLKNYYEVPVEVLEVADDLTAWASQATQR